jgi:pyridoxal phosphate enzyme (YggS family)
VVSENLAKVVERIASACQKAGRDPAEVKVVAVTKTHSPDVIRQAIKAGINNIGENRVQEAEIKYHEIDADVTWHLVGHLQRNKVRKALTMFSMIHSLDSRRLVREIEKESAKLDKIIPCLIEVNTSGEASKFGVEPDGLAELVTEVLKAEHIKLVGLMTIGPLTEDQDRIRRSFTLLRELRDRVENIFGCYLPHLSMGMSDDFEIAVQEGSTMVRLGRVLFGPRQST